MRHRKFLLPLALLLLAPAVAGVSFSATSQGDWEAGTFDSTEAVNGVLQLQSGESSGTYVSRTFDGGDNYSWDSLEVNTELNGGGATAAVETSRDGFATVEERMTFEASGGVESFDISSLEDTRYTRFNYTLTGDAEVNSTNVTLDDSFSFIIRKGSCQVDEREMFSISNRSNAHAGDPGHWELGVCVSGFEDSVYTQVCASDEAPVLSFAGSFQNYTHLSTDPDHFSHKLCTGALTIGVRDKCPETTKAVVSLYETDSDHVAEPGEYPHQLCGAFFESVTTMLEFHLGENSTVTLNETENPDEGLFIDLRGRDSWYIISDNGTVVTGIVSGENTFTTSVGYEEIGARTLFNMTQKRGSTGYYLPFAVATPGEVEDRVELIRGDRFLTQINPSFGFALAEEMTVRLTLRLSDIDVINDLVLSPGSHTISISNLGSAENVPKVGVNVTG